MKEPLCSRPAAQQEFTSNGRRGSQTLAAWERLLVLVGTVTVDTGGGDDSGWTTRRPRWSTSTKAHAFQPQLRHKEDFVINRRLELLIASPTHPR